MKRFYVKPERIEGSTAHLEPDQARRLVKVLRLKAGDEVVVFDGTAEYLARVDVAGKKEASLEIIEKLDPNPGPAFELYLAQAIIKGKRMDIAVEKAAELGAACIIPVLADRCVPAGKNFEARADRWRKIAQSAAAQCGRTDVTRIDPVASFEEAIKKEADLKVILYEKERETATQSIVKKWEKISGEVACPSVLLMVGPEGGFTDEEVARAVSEGWIRWGMGTLILRAETASIAGAAVLIHKLTGRLF